MTTVEVSVQGNVDVNEEVKEGVNDEAKEEVKEEGKEEVNDEAEGEDQKVASSEDNDDDVSKDKVDKDKDFEPDGDDDDDDDELEVDDEEEEKLSEEEQEVLEGEESDDDSDDNVITEEDLILHNPHFQPNLDSLLDWLGRRQKSLTLSEMHEGILICLRENVEFPVDNHLDQMVVGNTGSVVLECTSGQSYKELSKMETSEFARCKFHWKLVGSNQEEEQVEDYKRQKAWATWRYKGVQTGYAKWPDWIRAVTEWRQQQSNGEVAEVAAIKEVPKTDAELAAAIQEQGRRKTRHTGTDVFYGHQTGMSQKQLMDTVVRLAKPFQTITGLVKVVEEESTNPFHRVRAALGKLVWKRNQLTRLAVNSSLSDMPLWNTLRNTCLIQKTDAMPSDVNPEHIKVLTTYLRNLHRTELQLRSLILQHLTTIPIATVATAADERMGTMESLDAADFEENASLEWQSTGHVLLGQVIFRPPVDSTECMWYKIKGYVPSVPLSGEDVKTGEEAQTVERRMRFSAFPVDGDDNAPALILTEAQVDAGLVAGNMERKKASESSTKHPFASGTGSNITLQSDTDADIHCKVVGYNTVLKNGTTADSKGDLEHRVMLLPQLTESAEDNLAFWAVVSVDEIGVLTCQLSESTKTYKILQTNCDSSSRAFLECRGIVEFLRRQHNSAVFAEPVDPVALNIPTYFSSVKHPMDISTLSSNLEKGLYSKIPPGQHVGRSPVARMLNGPFKDDVVLMFDNAMLFNPPDDWIYLAAVAMKKAVLKKIEQVSREADHGPAGRQKKSIYVDEDSDVDLYEYESDDEDYDGRRKPRERKRKRAGGKNDDFSTRAMEAPITLRNTLSESQGLRGPFASLPINSVAAEYSLSSEWSCRHKTSLVENLQDAEDLKRKKELEELFRLQREAEEIERAGLRRSSRAHPGEATNGNMSTKDTTDGFEYFLAGLPLLGEEDADIILQKAVPSRSDVETQREILHEVYFAKLYQQLSKFLQPTDNGSYVNGSFPPFFGRVFPTVAPACETAVTWEIRAPYVIPAIRWVLRGLLHSGHIAELEDGVILTNDIYFTDALQQPFDELDVKEMQRRKRAHNADEEEESEEEFEMSEYEKMRAERVARNAERLKALGLA
jgi:hypothetical protein